MNGRPIRLKRPRHHPLRLVLASLVALAVVVLSVGLERRVEVLPDVPSPLPHPNRQGAQATVAVPVPDTVGAVSAWVPSALVTVTSLGMISPSTSSDWVALYGTNDPTVSVVAGAGLGAYQGAAFVQNVGAAGSALGAYKYVAVKRTQGTTTGLSFVLVGDDGSSGANDGGTTIVVVVDGGLVSIENPVQVYGLDGGPVIVSGPDGGPVQMDVNNVVSVVIVDGGGSSNVNVDGGFLVVEGLTDAGTPQALGAYLSPQTGQWSLPVEEPPNSVGPCGLGSTCVVTDAGAAFYNVTCVTSPTTAADAGTDAGSGTFAAGTYYLLVIDASALPANGLVTWIASAPVSHGAGSVEFVSAQQTSRGVRTASGIVVTLSTTPAPTLTAVGGQALVNCSAEWSK